MGGDRTDASSSRREEDGGPNHNNFGGNIMSSTKTVRCHLSLLAGASLAAMSIAATPALADETIAEGDTRTTAVTASPAANDTFTLDILGSLRGANGAGNVTNTSVQGSGAGAVVINNDGRWQGSMNFSAATGPITVNNNTGADPAGEGWHTGSTTTLGSGDDLIENADTGVIATTSTTTFNFGDGNDQLTNAGRLIIDRASTAAGTLTLSGLETFDNSGLILLGSKFANVGDAGVESDRTANDMLSAQGVAFTGSDGSRIAMDAMLAGVTQADCSSLDAADCVDFTGGSTAGSTLLTIQDTLTDDDAALNTGIAVVVGSSAAGDFTLDPNSPRYVQTSQGGALQKQLVAYHLVYDAANSRHMLVGILADEGFQAATFAGSAQETLRAVTGTWLDRQADLRGTPGGLEPSRGLWGRFGFSAGQREADGVFEMADVTYNYNLDHDQRIAQMTFGADLLGAVTDDAAWVVGAMGGLSRTDVEYDATPTEVVYTGFNGGIYGSWVVGRMFVDAVLSGSVLDLNAEVPNMHLGDNVNLTQTVKSYGAQLEGGWRFENENVFVEPIASLSFIRTKIEDIDIPGGGGSIDFEESYTSSRMGAGVRGGVDSELMGMPANYSLLVRYWGEGEGVNDAVIRITNGMTATPVSDDFTGEFTEIGARLNVYGNDGAFSGFVGLGGMVGHEYSNVNGSIGVRLRW